MIYLHKKTNKTEATEKNNSKKSTNDFGADPDEQEMNGLYGALETEYEDRLHDRLEKQD